MDSDIWLPLATLVLGWGLAQITETLRDRRTTTRERLAQRAELQRTTLLELQEAFLELSRGAIANLTFALGKQSGKLTEEEKEQPEWRHLTQAARDLPITRGRMELLASRVEDERVRELATAAAKLSEELDGEDPGGAQAFFELDQHYSVAVARIGELLRERY